MCLEICHSAIMAHSPYRHHIALEASSTMHLLNPFLLELLEFLGVGGKEAGSFPELCETETGGLVAPCL